MGLIAAYELTISIRTYIAREHLSYLAEHQGAFTAAVLIATIIRVSIDVYLYSLLATLVFFFFNKKRMSLDRQMKSLSSMNICVLAWTVTLILLNSAYRIIITIQFSSIIANPLSTSIYIPFVAVYVFTLFPLTTYLTAASLSQFFWYQATRSEEIRGRANAVISNGFS